MGQGLEKHIARAHFGNPILDAIINISVASNYLATKVDEACAPLGITGVQYNILRILKRAPEKGLSRNDIVRQLIEKSVDVTRSIDGLVQLGFVVRTPSETDRRIVLHTIKEEGVKALEQIDPNFRTMLNAIGAAFNAEELTTLSRLCEKIYTSDSGNASD